MSTEAIAENVNKDDFLQVFLGRRIEEMEDNKGRPISYN